MKTHPRTTVVSTASRLGYAGILKLLLSVFIGCASDAPLAQAAYKVEDRLTAIATEQFEWSTRQAFELSGIPVHVKSFSSTFSPVQTAQTLAVHSDLFQRVLTAKSKIVLTGMQPDWHWLAEIEPASGGAKGYVSALYVDSGQLSRGKAIDESKFQWLPSDAKKRFSHHTSEKSRATTQHLYSVSLAPGQLSAYVAQQLTAQGWIKELAVTGMNDTSAWRRKNARLTLFPHTAAAGTSLLVDYTE